MSPFFQDFYLDFLIVARTKEKKQLEKTGTLMFLPRSDQNNILKIGMFSDKKVHGIAQNLIKIYFGFGWKFPILTASLFCALRFLLLSQLIFYSLRKQNTSTPFIIFWLVYGIEKRMSKTEVKTTDCIQDIRYTKIYLL